MQDGQDKGRCLAATRDGDADDISALQCDGNSLGLDRSGTFVAQLLAGFAEGVNDTLPMLAVGRTWWGALPTRSLKVLTESASSSSSEDSSAGTAFSGSETYSCLIDFSSNSADFLLFETLSSGSAGFRFFGGFISSCVDSLFLDTFTSCFNSLAFFDELPLGLVDVFFFNRIIFKCCSCALCVVRYSVVGLVILRGMSVVRGKKV